jgi:hypothetical protein
MPTSAAGSPLRDASADSFLIGGEAGIMSGGPTGEDREETRGSWQGITVANRRIRFPDKGFKHLTGHDSALFSGNR